MPLPAPPVELSDLVRRAAGRAPGKAAFVGSSGAWTWAEVETAVDETARGLRALGLADGDRVALQLGNTPDFPVAYFGALRAGLVAVPVNTGYTAAEVEHVVRDSGARVLISGGEGQQVPGLDHVATVAGLRLPGAEPVRSGRGGEDLAVVLYTSGTSGRPRGAMLSHRALLGNLEQGARLPVPVVTTDDVVLLVLPLFHVYGLNAALGTVAREAATGLLVERFDPVQTLADLRTHGVTCVLGAPPLYVAWSTVPDLREAFAGVRIAVSGAAPLPRSVLARFREVTGRQVYEGYGLTETAPVLTSTLLSPVPKPDSVGRPLPGIEVRLVDESGREAEDGDPGEIVVRGANLFSGYWPDGAEGPDADGWWPTGDVAVADGNGDLHLVDRRRELILVSGFNVYPREVEDVLVRFPGVAEAAVVGVPHPYTGEQVKALLVAEPDAVLDPEEVMAFCARSLARFKCPTVVEVVAGLPHSATGKVSKGRLRERAADLSS